jgi:hypothetical protein
MRQFVFPKSTWTESGVATQTFKKLKLVWLRTAKGSMTKQEV